MLRAIVPLGASHRHISALQSVPKETSKMRAIMIAVVLSCMGCATGASVRPLASSAAPRIEASAPDGSELATACDSVRARGRHRPVYLSDGTPVWCF